MTLGIEIGIGTATVLETMISREATIATRELRLATAIEGHVPRRPGSPLRHRLRRWTTRRWRKRRCSYYSRKARRWRPSQDRNQSSILMTPMRPRAAAGPRRGQRLPRSLDIQPDRRRLDLAGRGARRAIGTITDGTIVAAVAVPVGHGADDATGREIDRCMGVVTMIESRCVTTEMTGATTVGAVAAVVGPPCGGTIATGGTGAGTGTEIAEIATTLLITVTIAGTIDTRGATGIAAGSGSESVIETGMTRRGGDHAPARRPAITTADGRHQDLDLGGGRGRGHGLARGAMTAIDPHPEQKSNGHRPDQGLAPAHNVMIRKTIRIIEIDPRREPRDIARALDGAHNLRGVLLPDGDRALDEDLRPDEDPTPATGRRILGVTPARRARWILIATSRGRAIVVAPRVVGPVLRFIAETETLVHYILLPKLIGTFPERTEADEIAREVATMNGAGTGSGHRGTDPALDIVSATVSGIGIGTGTQSTLMVGTRIEIAIETAAAAVLETEADPEIVTIRIGTAVGIAIAIESGIRVAATVGRPSWTYRMLKLYCTMDTNDRKAVPDIHDVNAVISGRFTLCRGCMNKTDMDS